MFKKCTLFLVLLSFRFVVEPLSAGRLQRVPNKQASSLKQNALRLGGVTVAAAYAPLKSQPSDVVQRRTDIDARVAGQQEMSFEQIKTNLSGKSAAELNAFVEKHPAENMQNFTASKTKSLSLKPVDALLPLEKITLQNYGVEQKKAAAYIIEIQNSLSLVLYMLAMQNIIPDVSGSQPIKIDQKKQEYPMLRVVREVATQRAKQLITNLRTFGITTAQGTHEVELQRTKLLNNYEKLLDNISSQADRLSLRPITVDQIPQPFAGDNAAAGGLAQEELAARDKIEKDYDAGLKDIKAQMDVARLKILQDDETSQRAVIEEEYLKGVADIKKAMNDSRAAVAEMAEFKKQLDDQRLQKKQQKLKLQLDNQEQLDRLKIQSDEQASFDALTQQFAQQKETALQQEKLRKEREEFDAAQKRETEARRMAITSLTEEETSTRKAIEAQEERERDAMNLQFSSDTEKIQQAARAKQATEQQRRKKAADAASSLEGKEASERKQIVDAEAAARNKMMKEFVAAQQAAEAATAKRLAEAESAKREEARRAVIQNSLEPKFTAAQHKLLTGIINSFKVGSLERRPWLLVLPLLPIVDVTSDSSLLKKINDVADKLKGDASEQKWYSLYVEFISLVHSSVGSNPEKSFIEIINRGKDTINTLLKNSKFTLDATVVKALKALKEEVTDRIPAVIQALWEKSGTTDPRLSPLVASNFSDYSEKWKGQQGTAE